VCRVFGRTGGTNSTSFIFSVISSHPPSVEVLGTTFCSPAGLPLGVHGPAARLGAGRPGADGAGRFIRSGLTTGSQPTSVVVDRLFGDDNETTEDWVGGAAGGRRVVEVLSSNPLDMDPLGDPTTDDVLDGAPPVPPPGGGGAGRFLRSVVVIVWLRLTSAGLMPGVTAVLPLLIALWVSDTTGTYDRLHCSCVDLFSLGICTRAQSFIMFKVRGVYSISS